jgi:hypothetical protein
LSRLNKLKTFEEFAMGRKLSGFIELAMALLILCVPQVSAQGIAAAGKEESSHEERIA